MLNRNIVYFVAAIEHDWKFISFKKRNIKYYRLVLVRSTLDQHLICLTIYSFFFRFLKIKSLFYLYKYRLR